jgi:hypothetical protein
LDLDAARRRVRVLEKGTSVTGSDVLLGAKKKSLKSGKESAAGDVDAVHVFAGDNEEGSVLVPSVGVFDLVMDSGPEEVTVAIFA